MSGRVFLYLSFFCCCFVLPSFTCAQGEYPNDDTTSNISTKTGTIISKETKVDLKVLESMTNDLKTVNELSNDKVERTLATICTTCQRYRTANRTTRMAICGASLRMASVFARQQKSNGQVIRTIFMEVEQLVLIDGSLGATLMLQSMQKKLAAMDRLSD